MVSVTGPISAKSGIGPGQDSQKAVECSTAAPWGNFCDLVVTKNDTAHPVALVQNPEGRQGCTFRRRDRFHVEDRAEEHRHSLIDHDQGGSVTLLSKDPDVGLAGACSDLPVDRTDAIGGQVVA